MVARFIAIVHCPLKEFVRQLKAAMLKPHFVWGDFCLVLIAASQKAKKPKKKKKMMKMKRRTHRPLC